MVSLRIWAILGIVIRSILFSGPRLATLFLATASSESFLCVSLFCLSMALSIFPAATGSLDCSEAVLTFSATATSASASCCGEPTKKLAVTTTPTPTTRRLNTLMMVSVMRAIVPSYRGHADRRLDRNPLYPKSGRLLVVPGADHKVFSGHHAIFAGSSRSGVECHRLIAGRQLPSRSRADGELYHAGSLAVCHAESLLAFFRDNELASTVEETAKGGDPRRPPDSRLKVLVGSEILDHQIDVDYLRPPVETQPVRGRVHLVLLAHRDVLGPG